MDHKLVQVGGKRYKLHTIPAYYAHRFLDVDMEEARDFNDDEILFLMSYVSYNGIMLEDENLIDEYVEGWAELNELVALLYDFNFSFLKNWKMWRVPSEDGFVSALPKQLSAFIHGLMIHEYATLAELKSVVSLKDAFEMQDSILTKALNEYRYRKLKGVE